MMQIAVLLCEIILLHKIKGFCMKKSLALSLLFAPYIAADGNKKADIVVVDLAKVVNAEKPEESKSTEWSEVFSKLKSEILGHRSKMEGKQREYEAKHQERQMKFGHHDARSINTISAEEKEAFNLLNEEIMKLEHELRLAMQLGQSTEQRLNDFQSNFYKKLTNAAEEVRVEEGAKIVLQGPVLAMDPSVDITEKVVKKMNAKHQTEQRAKKLTKIPEAKAPAKK